MAVLVRLPKLGANIAEGAVGAWRRKEGDSVRAGDPLVEIITSKATFELEAPADGILRKVLAPERSNIPVGYVVAIIGAAEEELPDPTAENERLLNEFRSQAKAQAPGKPAASVGLRATPGARRLARQAGVDLSQIPLAPGSDVLRESDVQAFLEKRRGG